MYVLGNLIGSISQSYAASGQAQSAAYSQAMNSIANSQMAYMQSAIQAQGNVNSQGPYASNALRNAYAPVVEPRPNYAEAVQPTEHELELMRWDENLAALKKKTAEMHSEIKARIFAKHSG